MRVLISGGGTGGHLFPALAIANKLKEENPETDILFVGAKGKIEMERVPKEGYPIRGLWISGVNRKLASSKNLLFPLKLLISLVKSFWIVLRFRPQVGIGVGGFASGPALFVAKLMGTPLVLQEQNSYPGITNKLLGKKADRICVAYDNMQRFFGTTPVVQTGNPVRALLQQPYEDKEAAARHFGLDRTKSVVFVFGGSLGARSINNALIASEEFFRSRPDIQLIWQTGKFSYEKCKSSPLAALENVKTLAFIDRMDLAYCLADVVVGRAGALTISELCLQAKAAILVPLPSAAEDHQTKNAMALVENGAAQIVKDKELDSKLIEQIAGLLDDEEQRRTMAEKIGLMAEKNALSLITKEINDLAK